MNSVHAERVTLLSLFSEVFLFQRFHHAFVVVAVMVDTIGTSLEISRFHNTSCLDGDCASGGTLIFIFLAWKETL